MVEWDHVKYEQTATAEVGGEKFKTSNPSRPVLHQHNVSHNNKELLNGAYGQRVEQRIGDFSLNNCTTQISWETYL